MGKTVLLLKKGQENTSDISSVYVPAFSNLVMANFFEVFSRGF